MLALNANRATSVDQLVDAIWDIDPPPTARGQIQVLVSALRKVLAGTDLTIRTQSPGYLLNVPSGQLDSELFAQLVASARTHAAAQRYAEAADDLHTALDLWRGPPLAGLPGNSMRHEATLLEDRRLAAYEERIRLDLLLGRHEEIVSELRALVAEQPLRERLYGFLMLSLYRSGRQAEALEAWRQARSVLVNEVGIEPGQELQDMAIAILNRDPALEPPKPTTPAPAIASRFMVAEQPVPRQLPASIADFTGREDLLDEIKQVLGRPHPSASPYAVRIVAISGRGGVGKSSLAIRAGQELSSAFPDGQLYADSRSSNFDDTAKVLTRFLRSLGVNGTAIPEDQLDRVRMYRSLLAGKRMLIMLDDVRTEAEVRQLVPGDPGCAVIITSRTRLSSLPGAHWIDVDVFDNNKSVELLGKIIGQDRMRAEPDVAGELADLCDGLPLALRIAGARLASRRHWHLADLVRRLRDQARVLDELAHGGLELRSNIGLTYSGLPAAVQRLFRLFGLVTASDFPAWVAAALLDVSIAEAENLIECLIDARVLDVVKFPTEGVLRYRLHDLINVYARERLAETESPAERRAALSRYLGGWLSLVEEAHRWEYGGDFTILHGAAPRWRPPEGGWYAVGDPMALLESGQRGLMAAISQAADEDMDELCWDLSLTSVTSFEAKGYHDEWLESARTAYAAARRADNHRGQAAMLYSLGTLHLSSKNLGAADRHLGLALTRFEALGDTHGCALVLRNAAHVHRLRGDAAAAVAKYDESLEKSRATGDLIAEAHILCSMARIRIVERDYDAATRMLDDALAICEHTRCTRVESQVMYRFAELHLAMDNLELARRTLNRTLRMVRGRGDRIGEAYTLYSLGVVRHREGRLDNAEATLSHSLALARKLGERWVAAQSRYALGEVALARGDKSTAVDHLVGAERLFDALGSALWHARTLVLLSEVHATLGDTAVGRGKTELAAQLLAEIDSTESARWTARLRKTQAALLADGAAG
jgi:DNA-binding SARP family transcriptional activator